MVVLPAGFDVNDVPRVLLDSIIYQDCDFVPSLKKTRTGRSFWHTAALRFVGHRVLFAV